MLLFLCSLLRQAPQGVDEVLLSGSKQALAGLRDAFSLLPLQAAGSTGRERHPTGSHRREYRRTLFRDWVKNCLSCSL